MVCRADIFWQAKPSRIEGRFGFLRSQEFQKYTHNNLCCLSEHRRSLSQVKLNKQAFIEKFTKKINRLSSKSLVFITFKYKPC